MYQQQQHIQQQQQQQQLQQEHHQQSQQFPAYPRGSSSAQQGDGGGSNGNGNINDGAGAGYGYVDLQPQQQQYSLDQQQRESIVGPSRNNGLNGMHQRTGSLGGGGGGGSATGQQQSANGHGHGHGHGRQPSNGGGSHRRDSSSGPYARPEPLPPAAMGTAPTHTVKASSTTSEFTKRKNWSQHIIDEIQDFMHVLSPSGDFMFVTPSVQELLGWSVEEVIGRPVSDLLHTDDLESYRRDLGTSMQEGQDLTLYARLRTKDDRYVLFEITGHPYYAEYNGQQNCKCFFAMGRPYPSKNQAMLDSFLELKFENERLRQELQVLYKEIEGGGGGADGDFRPAGFSSNPYDSPASPMRGGSFTKNTPGSVIDPVTGLVQAGGLLPSSSNTYGALGIGISANGSSKADGTEKKKKKPRVEEGEFVCRDCGTVDSPEWRKGPEGPKSLCNACGLRYAKLTSKAAKAAKAEKAK